MHHENTPERPSSSRLVFYKHRGPKPEQDLFHCQQQQTFLASQYKSSLDQRLFLSSSVFRYNLLRKAVPSAISFDFLYGQHLLGCSSSEALINAIWLNKPQFFGVRGFQLKQFKAWLRNVK